MHVSISGVPRVTILTGEAVAPWYWLLACQSQVTDPVKGFHRRDGVAEGTSK
jgi:hypothetical protein